MTLRNNGLYIDRLSMNFGGVVVFEDISIEAPPSKVTACIGPNGAGKTTIINIVCGVFPPGLAKSISTACSCRAYGRSIRCDTGCAAASKMSAFSRP